MDQVKCLNSAPHLPHTFLTEGGVINGVFEYSCPGIVQEIRCGNKSPHDPHYTSKISHCPGITTGGKMLPRDEETALRIRGIPSSSDEIKICSDDRPHGLHLWIIDEMIDGDVVKKYCPGRGNPPPYTLKAIITRYSPTYRAYALEEDSNGEYVKLDDILAYFGIKLTD